MPDRYQDLDAYAEFMADEQSARFIGGVQSRSEAWRGWNEAIRVVDPENVASAAVARKLGARNRGRGRLPPPYCGPAPTRGSPRA